MDPLPDEVKRFMEANIDTVDQLEILRVLGEEPAREWFAVELAREVQVAAEAIGMHLAALQARGLIAVQTKNADLLCRYAPRTPELEQQLRDLLRVYRQRPVTMIKFIYAKAQDVLRTFAEAFRLKKGS